MFLLLKRLANSIVLAIAAACTVPLSTACNEAVSPAVQRLAAVRVTASAGLSRADSVAATVPGLRRINHIVVIYLENHSFDNLYGEFPGAEGLTSPAALAAPKQVDATGTLDATLPELSGSPFPTTVPNAPFLITDYVPATVLRALDVAIPSNYAGRPFDDALAMVAPSYAIAS